MKFSILIPVYNKENKIRRCLDSIVNQTFSDFEIILIDDGSSDLSGTICDQYSNQYNFIKVYHKQNDGLYMARVDAINKASGEYLIFVDSDDYLENDALERINTVLSSNSGIDLVIFREKLYFENSGLTYNSPTIFKEGLVNPNDVIAQLVDSYDLNNMVIKCVKNSHDFNFMIHHHMNMAEDISLSCQLVWKCKMIYYLDLPLYIYVLNDESITHKVSIDNIINAATAYTDMLNMIIAIKRKEEYLKILLNRYIRNFAYYINEFCLTDSDLESIKNADTKIFGSKIWMTSLKYKNLLSFENKIIQSLIKRKKYKTVKTMAGIGIKIRRKLNLSKSTK